jgi:hypothetical protein
MKARLLITALMLACLPLLATAQITQSREVEKNGKKKTKTATIPEWGPAHEYLGDKYVYFPDYYFYYQPDKGYIYWENGGWTTSTDIPSYLSTIDLSRARIQIIEDLETSPQARYRTYTGNYPQRKVEVTVPVPEIR